MNKKNKPNKCILFVTFDKIDDVCANFNFDLCINGHKMDYEFAIATAHELLKPEVMKFDYIDNSTDFHMYDSIQDYLNQLAKTLKQLNYDSNF